MGKKLIVDGLSISERFTGKPSGYVGFDKGGTLSEAGKYPPLKVILFDETDKASPDIFRKLLGL